jgi:hypothetical protein
MLTTESFDKTISLLAERSGKKRLPLVSEAWMKHPNTPFITERLVDGRMRLVARTQKFHETQAQEEERMLNLYGERWTGIRQPKVLLTEETNWR